MPSVESFSRTLNLLPYFPSLKANCNEILGLLNSVCLRCYVKKKKMISSKYLGPNMHYCSGSKDWKWAFSKLIWEMGGDYGQLKGWERKELTGSSWWFRPQLPVRDRPAFLVPLAACAFKIKKCSKKCWGVVQSWMLLCEWHNRVVERAVWAKVQ